MDKLVLIQRELKAPKSNFNSFGKYKYRSCEDILEAVKPLLAKHGCYLTLSDDIIMVGDRIYVKATATYREGKEELVVTAFAREEAEKKGMDASQVTGTASSYARKYALNGLFLIDDTKDADTDEFHQETEQKKPERKKAEKKEEPKPEPEPIPEPEEEQKMLTPLQKAQLKRLMTDTEWENAVIKNGKPETWTSEQADRWIAALERRNDYA
jgi:hypothetical protein